MARSILELELDSESHKLSFQGGVLGPTSLALPSHTQEGACNMHLQKISK